MIPRYHIILGAVFTFLIWVAAPQTNLIYLTLVFLASFLVDIDHYIISVMRTKKIGLKNSFQYHKELREIELTEKKKGIKRKGDFHLFHTIEFHVLIGILSIWFTPFFYIFIGMVFHSLTDLAYILITDRFYRREFFFFNWLKRKF